MNGLDGQLFFRGFRKQLRERLGAKKADAIWTNAAAEYNRLLTKNPQLKRHKGAMALPAVVLYRALDAQGEDAGGLLNAYGDDMGVRFARIAHRLTSLPGVARLLWKHIDCIMDSMSGEKHGYKRRIVSEPPEMYGVDILSCPYHELAKEMNCEQAVLCICHMDKAYMKGFHHIRYERTTAVSEGAEYCDYRLRFDENKA